MEANIPAVGSPSEFTLSQAERQHHFGAFSNLRIGALAKQSHAKQIHAKITDRVSMSGCDNPPKEWNLRTEVKGHAEIIPAAIEVAFPHAESHEEGLASSEDARRCVFAHQLVTIGPVFASVVAGVHLNGVHFQDIRRNYHHQMFTTSYNPANREIL